MVEYVSPRSLKNGLRGNLRLKPLILVAAAAQTPFVQSFLSKDDFHLVKSAKITKS